MKASLFLRIAAIIGFVFGAGHSLGGPWTPALGVAETALINSMKSLQFTVMGASRTYWDFYFGFGLIISIYLFAQAFVLWQVASIAKSSAQQVRPIMLTLLASYLVSGIVAFKFLFVVPEVMSIAIAACIATAWVLAGREAEHV
ncbi:MAG: LIC_13387 family protein [Stenotrophobium sp.]